MIDKHIVVMVSGNTRVRLPIREVHISDFANSVEIVVNAEDFDIEQKLLHSQQQCKEWKAKYEAVMETLRIVKGNE